MENLTDKELLKLIESRFGKGAALVCKERKRQIDEEGFHKQHDDDHIFQELPHAGAYYMLEQSTRDTLDKFHEIWPWHDRWFKPTPDNRKREVVKGSALGCAEIDRLIREEEDGN